jgi:hypothetical protein
MGSDKQLIFYFILFYLLLLLLFFCMLTFDMISILSYLQIDKNVEVHA